jgi:hypothetical protein
VEKDYYYKLKKEIFNQHINLYYNKKEKDFGTKKENIEIQKITI